MVVNNQTLFEIPLQNIAITREVLEREPASFLDYQQLVNSVRAMADRDLNGLVRMITAMTVERKVALLQNLLREGNRNSNVGKLIRLFADPFALRKRLVGMDNTMAVIMGNTLRLTYGFRAVDSPDAALRFEKGTISATVFYPKESSVPELRVYNTSDPVHFIKMLPYQVNQLLPEALRQLAIEASCKSSLVDGDKLKYEGDEYVVKDITPVSTRYGASCLFVPTDPALIAARRENGQLIPDDCAAYLAHSTHGGYYAGYNVRMGSPVHFWQKEAKLKRNLMVLYRGSLYITRNIKRGINFDIQHDMRVWDNYGATIDCHKVKLFVPLLPVKQL